MDPGSHRLFSCGARASPGLMVANSWAGIRAGPWGRIATGIAVSYQQSGLGGGQSPSCLPAAPNAIEASVAMTKNPETMNVERPGMLAVRGERSSEGDPDTEKADRVDQKAAPGATSLKELLESRASR